MSSQLKTANPELATLGLSLRDGDSLGGSLGDCLADSPGDSPDDLATLSYSLSDSGACKIHYELIAKVWKLRKIETKTNNSQK